MLLFLGFGFLIFFSNPFILNEMLHLWEVESIPLDKLKKFDVAIILSGVTSDQPPRDRTNYTTGADRVLHPIHLFKIGRIKKILVTGGSGLLDNKREDSEANNIKRTLLLAGIKENDIEIEPKARNTHENAVFTKEILNNKYPGQKYLLVTSAFHMRRSLACFRKEEVDVTPFTVNLYQKERELSFNNILIPSVESLQIWHILLREWIGVCAYKISGYI